LVLLSILRVRSLVSTGRLIDAELSMARVFPNISEDEFGLVAAALAPIAAVRGETERAIELFEDVRIFKESGINDILGLTFELALLQIRQENIKVASGLLRSINPSDDVPANYLLGVRARAALVAAQGNEEDAGEMLRTELVTARVGGAAAVEVDILLELGAWHLRRGEAAEARECVDGAETPAARGRLRLMQAEALYLRSLIERSTGARAPAIEAARRGYAMAWCDGPPYAYARILDATRSILQDLGELEPNELPIRQLGSATDLQLTPITIDGFLESLAAGSIPLAGNYIEIAVQAGWRRAADRNIFERSMLAMDLDEERSASVLSALIEVAGKRVLDAAIQSPRPALRAAAARTTTQQMPN
jgi:hypothetical protein